VKPVFSLGNQPQNDFLVILQNAGRSKYFYAQQVRFGLGVGKPVSVGEFVLDGILHEFSRRSHVHFVENSRAVSADGGRTEGQCGGDLFGSFALAEETQNLKFAI
jgi:hypothetical protein